MPVSLRYPIPMGFMLKFFAIALTAMIGSIAFAAQDPVFVMCRNKKVVRTIQIKKENGQCVTLYTKMGVDREMASGKNYDSCVKVMKNIQENIEKAGWKCKAVETAGSSES